MEQLSQSRTTACDAAQIPWEVKEAIAESILNDVHRRISGQGEQGKIIIGEKPTDCLTSGFLLPPSPERQEERTGSVDIDANPINIGTCGLDVGIRSESAGKVRVWASFSVYVRILPSEDDLAKNNNPVKFTLQTDIRRQIRNRVNAIRRREQPKYQTGREEDRQQWKKRLVQIRREVNESFGIELQAQETLPEEEAGGEQGEEGPGESPGASIFSVSPGDERLAADDLFNNSRPVGKWLRLEVEPQEIEFDPMASEAEIESAAQKASNDMKTAIRRRIERWLESDDPETGGKLWAYPRGQTFSPDQIRNWSATLQEIRSTVLSLPLERKRDRVAPPIENLDVRWAIKAQRDWSEPGRMSLHVALENWSELPGQNRRMESDESIFQVTVGAVMDKSMHYPMRLERVQPSYRYNEYLQYPAIGFNCGITAKESDGELHLQTTWVPKYALPRIDPQEHGKHIKTTFQCFANPESAERQGRAIADALDRYIDKVMEIVDPARGLDPEQTEEINREKDAFENCDIPNWRNEAAMIRRGVDLLAESAKASSGTIEAAPFEAFSTMNRTMERIAEGKYNKWRLFQIAFILATLPSLVSRIPLYSGYYRKEWDQATTLLYFATGGGKTEAFLGLLIFGLFLDRLRGKKRGVTAMIRYPLRLLTIQQAQRAAEFLAQAEKERVERSIEGAPFSIGFWVGGNNTPNRTQDQEVKDMVPFAEDEGRREEELRQENRNYRIATEKWVKLPQCPFCTTKPVGIRRYRKLEGQVGYRCENEACWWNVTNPGQPLPFHLVDDDIYALAPSVLLGTVDKLALIGQHYGTIRRVLGMFGPATWMDQQTGRFVDALKGGMERVQAGPDAEGKKGVFPAYQTGEHVFHDPFPSLVIQDEAHLLEESLGTFAGLFETALNETFRELGGKMDSLVAKDPEGNVRQPKVVVASATVSEPEKQIGFLYQQQLIFFPWPGPSQYWSFYAAPRDEKGRFMDLEKGRGDIERQARKRRIYASLLTNGKPHTTATVNILSAFHLNITRLMCDLGSRDPQRQQRGKDALIASLPSGHRQAVYRDSILRADVSELATMVDMHRVALTYVTNKKGGDQVMSAESQQVPEEHLKHGFDIGDSFRPELITGSVDVANIKKVMDRAQNRPGPGKPFDALKDVLRSVVATSAVSHGVDVEELNSMFFAGMPSDIAEYIQASSRVGRSHVGICALIPIPQRKRDRYIVEIHDIFHRFLERMVRPAAIDRWAENAIERVVPSFFQTYVCGLRPLKQFIDADDGNKHQVKRCIRVNQIISIGKELIREELDRFIRRSIGLYADHSPPTGSLEYYEQLVDLKVREILDIMDDPRYMSEDLAGFFSRISSDAEKSVNKPMLSLRDVDQPGQITLRKSPGGLDDEKVSDLMRFLLRGAGASSEVEQGS